MINNHVPLKKNFVRANHVLCTTKATMKCSELESKYLRNFTVENRNQNKMKIIFVGNYTRRNVRSFIEI